MKKVAIQVSSTKVKYRTAHQTLQKSKLGLYRSTHTYGSNCQNPEMVLKLSLVEQIFV